MTQNLRVGVLVGSLARDSLNRRFARAAAGLAPEGMEFVELDISGLPVYNRDLEADNPLAAAAFKRQLADVDALIIVAPEHNRGIPAALANALEWGSRPRSASPFAGLPTTIAGVTPGSTGTAAMQQHLRPMLSALAAVVMPGPEMYLQSGPDFFDADGALAIASTRDLVRGWLATFQEFASRLRRTDRVEIH